MNPNLYTRRTRLSGGTAKMLRVLFLLILFLGISDGVMSQSASYNMTFAANVATNPGGLNTETDALTTGWTLIPGSGGTISADQWSSNVTLPFAFDFFGTPVTEFKVSQGGVLTFTTAAVSLPGSNVGLPAAGLPDLSIAMMWDDFTNTPATGSNDQVWYKVFGAAPNRQLWIKYFSFEMGNPSLSFVYMSAVLEETTNNVYVVDQYNISALGSTSVGVQYNGSFAVQDGTSPNITHGSPTNGTAITDNDVWTFTPFSLLPCVDPPTSGTSVITPSTQVCPTSTVSFSLSGNSIGTGQTYQWMSGPTASGPWTLQGTPSAGAAYATTVTSSAYWRCEVTCGAGKDTSVAIFSDVATLFPGGTYTINNAGGADFLSISDAITAIQCGIAGPIVFDIVPGSGPYVEQVTIPQIVGASATNTVTINGNLTTITHASTNTNYREAFLLDGADHIIIDSMIIDVTGGTYGWGIRLTNSADSNVISNCQITALANSTSTNYAGIVMSGSVTSATTAGDNGDGNLFQGNTINNGYYGFTLVGSSTAPFANNNRVINNTVIDHYLYGIYAIYNENTEFSQNNIYHYSRSTTTSCYGVYLTTSCSNVLISKNRIYNLLIGNPASTSIGYGIYVLGDGLAGTENKLYNNIIYDFKSNGAQYGIYNSTGDYMQAFHNTISLDDINATSGATYGIYQTGAVTNINLKNNIINITRAGTGTRYGLNFVTAGTYISCNNNDIYVNSGGNDSVGFYAGTPFTTLANWQTANGGAYDGSSVSVDPMFANPLSGDFTPTNTGVNSNGENVGVADDILGNPRNLTSPDPGAYEWTPLGTDAGITWISPMSPVGLGNQTITVEITNAQTATITSLELSYTDGVSTETETFGPLTITAGNNQQFSFTNTYNLSGNANLRAYVSLVNGVLDDNQLNDTTAIQNICPAMSGNYTINSAVVTGGTNFQSFTDAVNQLICSSVNGPVVLDVVLGSGPYNEQVIIPEIGGASASNTITFNGNMETMAFASVNTNQRAVITLSGADHIYIDSLTIDASGGTYGFGVHLISQADSNKITNCIVNTTANLTSTNYAGIVMSGSLTSATTAGNSGNGNEISGNTINNGYYGITVVGTSTAPFISDNRVLNNIITDHYLYGIYSLGNTDTEFKGNEFKHQTRTAFTTMYGLFLTTNTIGAQVIGNRIHDFFVGGTSASTAYGIYVSGDALLGSENKLINNLVYNFHGTGIHYGLYNTGGNHMWAWHNTISFDNATAASGTTYGIYQTAVADSLQYYNNNISITRSGTGTRYGIFFNTAGTHIKSNYNNIYVNTPGSDSIGSYAGTPFTTLVDWQTANAAAYDQQSVNADPIFVDPSLGNYQPSIVALDNVGTPLGVVDDITYSARSLTTPDIGAYEYFIASEDIGVTTLITPVSVVSACYSNAETITVRIKNYGLNAIDFTINPATITCNVTVATVVTLFGTPSGILAINGTMDVVMSTTLDMTTIGTYTFNASVSMTGDGNAANDAMTAATRTTAASLGSISADVSTICVSGVPTLTLTGAIGNVQWQESLVGNTGPWTNVGTNSNVYTPSSSITDTTWYQAEVTCNAFSGTTNVVQVDYLLPQILSTENDTVCGQGSVTLSATSTGQGIINWYDVATGGTALGTGSTFTTNITGTTTFYAEEQLSGGGGSSASIQITEIDLGTNDQLEIQNVSPNSINVTGWKVAVSDNYTDITSVNTIVQTLSGSMAPGQTMTWTDLSSGPNYWGNNLFWNPGAYPSFTGWAAILDNNNNLVDVLFMNWPSANIQGASISIPSGPTLTVGSQWSGDGVNITSVAGTQSVSRQGTSDNNASTDFSIINLSVGTTNPGMTIPFTGFGCSSTRVAALGVSTSAPAITVTPGNALCPGDSIGIQVSSVNDPNYEYTWTSNPGGFSQSGNGPFYVTPVVNTTYYVTALDTSSSGTGGCLISDSVVVIPLATFSAGTVSATGPYCISGEPTISVTGASGFIQWQESVIGGNGPWTNVGIANSTTYTPGIITQTTYYRVLVSCISTTDSSNVDTVFVNNPQVLTSNGDTRCGPGSVDLTATTDPGYNLNWYADSTGGALLGTGSPFTTPLILQTDTFYVESNSGSGSSDSLQVPIASGTTTGVYHHMFTVNSPDGMQITKIGIKCNNTIGTLTAWDIYYRPDDFKLVAGANTSSAGWTLVSTVTNVPSEGATTYTTIATGISIDIPAGATYSIYVAPATGATHQYGTSVAGTVVGSNAVGSVIAGYRGSALFNCTTTSGFPVVSLEYSLGCPSARVPVIATVTPSPAIAVSGNDSICQGDSTTISISAGLGDYTTFAWFPNTGLSNDTGSVIKAAPSVTTKYYVLASGNVGNCQALDSITITVNDFDLSVSMNNPMLCGASDSTQITATATGGTFSYLWTPAAGLSNDTIPNPKARPVGSSETYTLTVTNTATGCIKTSSVTIYVSAPAILSTVADTVCGTDQVSLIANATPGTQISWWSAATGGTRLGFGSPFTPTISSTTKFYVETRDTIPQGPLNTVYTGGIIATDPNAAGNMFDITAINNIRITGFNVNLNDVDTLAPSNIKIYYKVGSYSGFVTNASAWTLVDSINGIVSAGAGVPTYLPLNLELNINAGQTYGIFISVSNLGVSNSLLYSSSATSPAEFAVASSDANLQVKSGTICFGPFTGQVAAPVNRLWNGGVLYSIGCISARDSVEAVSLTAPAISLATLPNDTICTGSSVTLQASSLNDPNYSYEWNPGALPGASVVVTPSSQTKYYVTATDTSSGGTAGCIVVDSVTINLFSLPIVNPTATPNTICAGEVTQLASNALGATPQMDSLATGLVDGNGSSLVGFDIVNTSALPVTINNFSFRSNITAGTTIPVTLMYSTTPLNCVNPTNFTPLPPGWVSLGVSNATAAGPAPALTFVPLNANVTIPPGATYAFALGSTTGSTVRYTDGVAGCPNVISDSKITIKGGFGGSLTGTTIANRNFAGRISYTIPAVGSLSYLWSPSTGLSSTTDANPTAVPLATTNYSVVVTNNDNGCTSIGNVNVTVNDGPKPVIVENDTTLCNPDQIYIHVADTGAFSGGYPSGTQFTWSAIGVPIVDLDSISSINGSSYSVIVTLPSGCTAASDTITVLTKSVAVVETINSASCVGGGSIEVTVTSGLPNYNYVWSTDLA
ncbi:MAG: right-handed parallel beta-helix repeat-containing protein [Bacteroidetes bacterium]|nr:right-handed parallel beta-helix repeat-containing protein [Bacteroidota bacterium]